MVKEKIKLTDNPAENICIMAPYLTEKQQYMLLGMILANAGEKPASKRIKEKIIQEARKE